MMNNKVVYAWFDGNECFYIGIGSKKRSLTLHHRNTFTTRKRKKSKDFRIEILHSGLNKEQACWYERMYIRAIGRRDLGLGALTNLTDGGELNNNYSEEHKRKLSESSKGRQSKISIPISTPFGNFKSIRKAVLDERVPYKKYDSIVLRLNDPDNSEWAYLQEKQNKLLTHTPQRVKIRVRTPKGTFSSSRKAGLAHGKSHNTILKMCKDTDIKEYEII